MGEPISDFPRRRLESAKKLITREQIELAKKWIVWRDGGYYNPTDLDAAREAHNHLSHSLSSISIPSRDDLWLAAQALAEEEENPNSVHIDNGATM